ncbi:MAG: hypothetical protein ABFD00_10520 [Chloroherpetonaceae bacterium]
MLIRQDFQNHETMPPRLYMNQIMDNVSRVYCFLWDNKDKKHRFTTTWKNLSLRYNKNLFRTSLRKLNDQGLVSYKEDDKGVLVELVAWK